jgi:hypothetical protein
MSVRKNSATEDVVKEAVTSFCSTSRHSASAPADALIEDMLKRRLRQDSADQAVEAEHRRKMDERARFCKLVLSEAETTIASPLAGLVDRFNRQALEMSPTAVLDFRAWVRLRKSRMPPRRCRRSRSKSFFASIQCLSHGFHGFHG